MTVDPLSLSVLLLSTAIIYVGARVARSLDAIGVQLTRISRALLGESGGQEQKATVPATANRALEAAAEIARRKSA